MTIMMTQISSQSSYDINLNDDLDINSKTMIS